MTLHTFIVFFILYKRFPNDTSASLSPIIMYINTHTFIFPTLSNTVFYLPYVLIHLLIYKLISTDIWMHIHCLQSTSPAPFLILILVILLLCCDILLSLFSILFVAVIFPYLPRMKYFYLPYLLLT